MKHLTPGAFRVYPVALRHDQMLDVICEPDGTFIRIEETMPPICNFVRLPMPQRHEERTMREREWQQLQAAMYQGGY